MCFDSVRPEDRAKAIALYSTINAVGWSVGALLGSWLVEHLPARIEWAGVILQPASNLPFVFFLSGVLRLLVSSSLLGTFHEARQVERSPATATVGIAARKTRCTVCDLDPTQIESVGCRAQ